jgi:hypothetical protein
MKSGNEFLKNQDYCPPATVTGFLPASCPGEILYCEKEEYPGKTGFFLGNFFEFLVNCRQKIHWQGHTPEDIWQNLFHYRSAFWGGHKLTDRLMALTR